MLIYPFLRNGDFCLGSWLCHGGWCWKKTTPLLSRAGHNVYTPTCTGLGERSHLATRDTGLDTNILDIIQVLEYEDLNEIILVGHSCGGVSYRWRSTENS
jgi:pimeloyl-ACP methyl ester carboxylesterase